MIVDKFGNEFTKGAIVKVYHFTGARKRKHYMYKLVLEVLKTKVLFNHIHTLEQGATVSVDFYSSEKECNTMQIVEEPYVNMRDLKIR